MNELEKLSSLLTQPSRIGTAAKEYFIDLIFEHLTGTRLSLARVEQQVAELHAKIDAMLGADLANGMEYLERAVFAKSHGSEIENARYISLAEAEFTQSKNKLKRIDPGPAAESAKLLGFVLDLTGKHELALQAYEEAYELYHLAKFHIYRDFVESVVSVPRYLGRFFIFYAYMDDERIERAAYVLADQIKSLDSRRDILCPALMARGSSVLAKIERLEELAQQRYDSGKCRLCGRPMSYWDQRIGKNIHSQCTNFVE